MGKLLKWLGLEPDPNNRFGLNEKGLDLRWVQFEGLAEVVLTDYSDWVNGGLLPIVGVTFYENKTNDDSPVKLLVKDRNAKAQYCFTFKRRTIYGSKEDAEEPSFGERKDNAGLLIGHASRGEKLYVKGETKKRPPVISYGRFGPSTLSADAYTGIIEVDDVPAYSFEIDLNKEGERANVLKKLA